MPENEKLIDSTIKAGIIEYLQDVGPARPEYIQGYLSAFLDLWVSLHEVRVYLFILTHRKPRLLKIVDREHERLHFAVRKQYAETISEAQ